MARNWYDNVTTVAPVPMYTRLPVVGRAVPKGLGALTIQPPTNTILLSDKVVVPTTEVKAPTCPTCPTCQDAVLKQQLLEAQAKLSEQEKAAALQVEQVKLQAQSQYDALKKMYEAQVAAATQANDSYSAAVAAQKATEADLLSAKAAAEAAAAREQAAWKAAEEAKAKQSIADVAAQAAADAKALAEQLVAQARVDVSKAAEAAAAQIAATQAALDAANAQAVANQASAEAVAVQTKPSLFDSLKKNWLLVAGAAVAGGAVYMYYTKGKKGQTRNPQFFGPYDKDVFVGLGSSPKTPYQVWQYAVKKHPRLTEGEVIASLEDMARDGSVVDLGNGKFEAAWSHYRRNPRCRNCGTR